MTLEGTEGKKSQNISIYTVMMSTATDDGRVQSAQRGERQLL